MSSNLHSLLWSLCEGGALLWEVKDMFWNQSDSTMPHLYEGSESLVIKKSHNEIQTCTSNISQLLIKPGCSKGRKKEGKKTRKNTSLLLLPPRKTSLEDGVNGGE